MHTIVPRSARPPMPNVPPFACRNPHEDLFWDGVHPTTAAHSLIAEAAALSLAQ